MGCAVEPGSGEFQSVAWESVALPIQKQQVIGISEDRLTGIFGGRELCKVSVDDN